MAEEFSWLVELAGMGDLWSELYRTISPQLLTFNGNANFRALCDKPGRWVGKQAALMKDNVGTEKTDLG